MKRLLLPAILFVCWLVFLSVDIPVGENFLPALGRFVDPFHGIWQSVSADLSSHDLKGKTKAEIKILFDERDVPHIYANSIEDAIYAQGYLHAANRLFAMDMSTRAAAGRLSELVGPRTLAYDHKQRERGFEASAIEKAKNWETYEDVDPIITAYVNGVNGYIQSLDYKTWPIEYKILSHGPVEWTAKHTALMAMNMAIMLCLSEHDLPYTNAKALLTPEDFQFLYPNHNPLESPIIPAEKSWNFTSVQLGNVEENRSLEVIESKIPVDKQKDINGSNNWAISPKKTANGFPLLANDPHLSLTLPNIWYEMEIHTPEMSVHGASIPGLPYIVIGFNELIAWGTTNSGQDVLDWYKINWEDSSRLRYKLDDAYVNATIRVEEIVVRGQPAIVDSIRYTYWGPVTSSEDHKDMAMRWIGHQRAKANDVAYLQKINTANNVTDYRNAIEAFEYPAQNKVFASVEGDIAISVAGTMPLRAEGRGTFILEGDDKKNDWTGFIPFDHAPYIINPKKGYVSSANQTPTAQSYPYPMVGNRTFEDYRGRVINMVLDSSNGLTVEDMKALQQNNFNLHAAEILPLLLSSLEGGDCPEGTGKGFIDRLKGWNYEQHRDSISPILFELWYEEFEKMTFDELDSLKLMHPEDWRIVEMVREGDQHKYFDIASTPERIEKLTDIVCASFNSMTKTFSSLELTQQKNWGNYKATEIPHLARFAPFGASLMHTSGNKHIVNSMGKSHGPSWRMIVELSKPPRAYVNLPGGQSGNPASPHFRDMLDQFFEGKYYEVSLKPDASSWIPTRQINIHTK